MDLEKDSTFRRLKWYIIAVGIALALTLLLAVFTNTFQKPQASGLLQLSSILIQLLLLLAVVLMLSMMLKKLDSITEDSTKVSIRPSGTEPKIKFYFSVKDTLENRADYPSRKTSLEEKIKQLEKELGIEAS